MTYSELHDNQALSRFASKEWEKSLGYLHKSFGLSRDDCEDVFQEAFMTLYQNITEGKLVELTCSLSTYFMSICRNKAMEMLRGLSKMSVVDDEMSLSLMDGEFKEDRINALLELDDESYREERQQLVVKIVQDLPSPCNELLWGFYRDDLSMKTLAEMFNYKSESSVKVTKHRCCEKFRARYQEMCKSLF